MIAPRQLRPRVVVVGGGFAGLQAVRGLRGADIDVLLLDRAPYTTFQPLLYQVATGGLNPGDVTYALRAFAGKYASARFRRATVVGVDTDVQKVYVKDADAIEYDFLILSVGVAANYFNIPGAAEYSMTIYRPGAAVEESSPIWAGSGHLQWLGRPGWNSLGTWLSSCSTEDSLINTSAALPNYSSYVLEGWGEDHSAPLLFRSCKTGET